MFLVNAGSKGIGMSRQPAKVIIEPHRLDAASYQQVRLLGALSEQATLNEIARADALVLPSLMEGLPVVLMEAMALGKPVIASCVAGIPELVHDGVTGLLFRPSDWDQLGERMRFLAHDRPLRTRLADAGRVAVATEFAIDIAVEPLARLFAEHQVLSHD